MKKKEIINIFKNSNDRKSILTEILEQEKIDYVILFEHRRIKSFPAYYSLNEEFNKRWNDLLKEIDFTEEEKEKIKIFFEKLQMEHMKKLEIFIEEENNEKTNQEQENYFLLEDNLKEKNIYGKDRKMKW